MGRQTARQTPSTQQYLLLISPGPGFGSHSHVIARNIAHCLRRGAEIDASQATGMGLPAGSIAQFLVGCGVALEIRQAGE